MKEQSSDQADLYALLIGIDYYFPNNLPDGSCYHNLRGCVRDITHIEDFLKTKLTVADEHIIKLTSSNKGDGMHRPLEPSVLWPTYQNMVTAFRKLSDMAQPGDQVFIYYSGHGGRAKTAFPQLKSNGLDEVLVPIDIGNPEARYLRDVELAYLLQDMVDQGLFVTIVLDCCHSGGTTRGQSDVAVRGIAAIDRTERPTNSLVASPAALAARWNVLTQDATRQVSLGASWLPEPKGYVLLAACRPQEFAYEYAFDGQNRHGALSYWLLDALQQLGTGLTYRQVHNRVLAKVHTQFKEQTPQLLGEGERTVFGSERVVSQYAVTVMQVDMANNKVLLNAGQAQGVSKGAQFGIYPPRTRNFTPQEQIALAKIVKRGATNSWAELEEVAPGSSISSIQSGAQAVLLHPASARLRRTLCLVKQADLLDQVTQDKALAEVRVALDASKTGFVSLVAAGKPADFQVAVNAQGEYEIWDAGGQSIPNLRPVINMNAPQAAERLVQRLIHLTKYANVRELDNSDSRSPLARKLLVELIGVQKDYEPGDPPEPEPFSDLGHTPTFNPNESTFLRIKNDSWQVLNITVLSLQPNWAIQQIYPPDAANFYAFDPGEEEILPLNTYLPEGYTEATDILKVFATVGNTNFRWLELPPLDQPQEQSLTTRNPNNPSETLLASITVQEPPMRHLVWTPSPSWEWVTAQVEIHVVQSTARQK